MRPCRVNFCELGTKDLLNGYIYICADMHTFVYVTLWPGIFTTSFAEGVYRFCIQKTKRDCLQGGIQTLAVNDMPQTCGYNAVLKCVSVGTQS